MIDYQIGDFVSLVYDDSSMGIVIGKERKFKYGAVSHIIVKWLFYSKEVKEMFFLNRVNVERSLHIPIMLVTYTKKK